MLTIISFIIFIIFTVFNTVGTYVFVKDWEVHSKQLFDWASIIVTYAIWYSAGVYLFGY